MRKKFFTDSIVDLPEDGRYNCEVIGGYGRGRDLVYFIRDPRDGWRTIRKPSALVLFRLHTHPELYE